jgi:hypothetical protein
MSREPKNASLEITVWRVVVEISVDEGEDFGGVFVKGGGDGGEDYLGAGLVGEEGLVVYGYVEEACEAVAWRAEGDGVVIFEFYEVFSHV